MKDSGDTSATRIIETLPPKVPLYAMCTSFLDWSKGEQISDEKIRLVARLGFSGVQPEIGRVGDFNGVQGKFTAMRMADLRMNALFVGCFADESGITLPSMETLMLYCRPFSSALWLSISYGNTKTPDRAKIVESLKQIAKECERNGVDLIIYPHEGNYIDNAAAAIELANESGCKNVFVTYNLIHEYWYAKRVAKNMEMTAPEAMAKFVLDNPDKIKIVTVNGINSDDWICPLGTGDFDTGKFAHAIVDGGYNGVIGLQGFGTWGQMPMEDALAMSMKAWKEWFAK